MVFHHLLYGWASFLLPLQFAFNMEQGLPVMPEWLFFNRVNARVRKSVKIGPAHLLLRYYAYYVLLFCIQGEYDNSCGVYLGG